MSPILDHQNTQEPSTSSPPQPFIIDINNHNDNINNGNKSFTPQSKLSVLTSFHAGYFRITISLACQALLWKALSSPTADFYISVDPLKHVSRSFASTAYILLWSICLAILTTLSFLYLLRCLLRFDAVKAEYEHHIGVNYLFAPWISWLILLQSTPFIHRHDTVYLILWWVFTVPVLALEVKIYGQWFTKGKRFLSMVANPTSQMSVIANMVCARAAAQMGWKEMALCLFAIAFAHYMVLFVTLYQRFSDRIPSALRPVFFLFFATPSFACLAWSSIAGSFDVASKMLFFLSLFLFASLVLRPVLFKKALGRFNVAWWAFSFPLTELALASIKYSKEVKGVFPNGLMLILSVVSVVVMLVLMVYTVLNSSMILPFNDPFKAASATTSSSGGGDSRSGTGSGSNGGSISSSRSDGVDNV